MAPIQFGKPQMNCRANESIVADLYILYNNYSAGDVIYKSSDSDIASVVESDGDYNAYCKTRKCILSAIILVLHILLLRCLMVIPQL